MQRMKTVQRMAVAALSALAIHVTWAQELVPTEQAVAAEAIAKDLLEETAFISVTVKNLYGRAETRKIPVTIYRPQGQGPFPLVVFNHGRAVIEKRAKQGRNRPEHFARYLVAKGFVVMAPTRVGYADTFGEFDPEEAGGCRSPNLGPMSIAASDQVLATVDYARSLAYVDTSRWIVAGQSVGGLTSVATVGRNPVGLLAGINFSGGSGGNPDTQPGNPCSPNSIANHWGELAKSAKVPMLWLYWQNDKYWGPDYPKKWHRAWVDAGAQASFVSMAAAGKDGHNGFAGDMDHWLPVVDAFLVQLGFSRSAVVVAPAATDYAAIGDLEKVPVDVQTQTTAYAKFLASKLPRAFAVGPNNAWGIASGDYAMGRALGMCQRSGRPCQLYAVDDHVVWVERK